MVKNWLITISVATLLVSGAVQAAGDPQAGEEKANSICMACHGPQGNSIVPIWPKLAGQHPEYIIKQLNDYRAGNRANEQMTPMAMPLTDQEVLDLAAYFALQAKTPGEADPELATLGESIYRWGNPESGVPACGGCHGPAGQGQSLAKFPRLSGQHADYTKQTLEHFRDSLRANDPNGMMRGAAARLTDQEIAAVSQYIQGLSQ
ncbi:cytochrome c4 [Thiocapsa imhoffii]|uniref:Cytochrome c4 n=1 Tax=Thiocapsa imhoffii TaxID=382777 RepID=A0A9X0WEP7_9GAMM|nr:c-type cytochrome [Thiocapsa imhoffii]MBK1643334.1 cytochrome c4 [Thiocapsa imhoffii]